MKPLISMQDEAIVTLLLPQNKALSRESRRHLWQPPTMHHTATTIRSTSLARVGHAYAGPGVRTTSCRRRLMQVVQRKQLQVQGVPSLRHRPDATQATRGISAFEVDIRFNSVHGGHFQQMTQPGRCEGQL